MYYIFRLLGTHPIRVACSKWEEGSIAPSATYIVYPGTNSCNCVASKRECRHVLRAKELVKPDLINDMYKWRWDERNGWLEMHDIPYIDEFERAVFAS